MATNYPVGDFLAKTKNAVMARKKEVEFSGGRQVFEVAKAIGKLGFFEEVKKDKGMIHITLTFKDKKPVLRDIKLISKPGLRIYMGASEIAEKRGPSTFLISSPKGIISSREAIKNRAGGEVIAEVW